MTTQAHRELNNALRRMAGYAVVAAAAEEADDEDDKTTPPRPHEAINAAIRNAAGRSTDA